MTRQPGRDRGAVLVLVLLLTVILAVVILALVTFVETGLRTSDTTDLRSETNADGGAAISWAMEEFRLGGLTDSDCPSTGAPIAVPPNVAANGSVVTLSCTSDLAVGSFPVVTLEATATKDSVTRLVKAVAQYAPPPDSAARTLDWSVDDVPLVP